MSVENNQTSLISSNSYKPKGKIRTNKLTFVNQHLSSTYSSLNSNVLNFSRVSVTSSVDSHSDGNAWEGQGTLSPN